MKKRVIYDPEYDRLVTMKEVKRQFDFFCKEYPAMMKNSTLEKFLDENFIVCDPETAKIYISHGEEITAMLKDFMF